jgi:hypothetical protein
MSGAAGTGNTSTGVGASTGASSTNTVGQVNAAAGRRPTNNNPISPANPSTAQLGDSNSLPVPNGTVTQQNAEQFDPRLSPGYQK